MDMKRKLRWILILLSSVNCSLKEFDHGRFVNICPFCECSEVVENPQSANGTMILEILCLEKYDKMPDLDMIIWPENKKELKIAAAFRSSNIEDISMVPLNTLVVKLEFESNYISTYWPEPFKSVPNLKCLSITRNSLRYISPDLFSGIDNLEEFDFSYNYLSRFNPISFYHLKDLKKINLHHNNFKSIPIDVLSRLPSLEDLDISENHIYDLKLQRRDTVKLKSLKRLNLNRNVIRTINEDAFPKESKLEYLNLASNKIEMIEVNAFRYAKNLKELDLTNNNISTIGSLPPNLRVADIKVNYIEQFPSTFPQAITSIDLSYNLMKTICGSKLDKFPLLEVLKLDNNKLTEFCIEKPLPKLRYLSLIENEIQYIPQTLSHTMLPNLEELYLDLNRLQSAYFPEKLLLRNLYMQFLPELTEIDKNAFINVQGRGPYTQTDGCFYLHMKYGKALTKISSTAFRPQQLCLLDVSHSRLTYLPPESLHWVRTWKNESLNLQQNPWNCICELQWMVDKLLPIMANSSQGSLLNFVCHTPEELRGYRLVHLYGWKNILCTYKPRDILCKSVYKDCNKEEDEEWSAFWSYYLGIAFVISVLLVLYIYYIGDWNQLRQVLSFGSDTSGDISVFKPPSYQRDQIYPEGQVQIIRKVLESI